MVLTLKNGLILPETGYELSQEEMMYVDGGWFLGIDISPEWCMKLSSIFNSKALEGVGTSISAVILLLSSKIPAFATALTTFTTALSAIPVWGWICIGVLATSLTALLFKARVAGSRQKGFRIGFEIGWFSAKNVSGEY